MFAMLILTTMAQLTIRTEQRSAIPTPILLYGFNIALDYKGFDFWYRHPVLLVISLYSHGATSPISQGNYSTEILGRWTGPGSSKQNTKGNGR